MGTYSRRCTRRAVLRCKDLLHGKDLASASTLGARELFLGRYQETFLTPRCPPAAGTLQPPCFPIPAGTGSRDERS